MSKTTIDSKDLEELKRKASNYDEICELFFKKNFGTTPKTTIELLMFHQYMERLEKENPDPAVPGTILYENISDFKIGRFLGITPARVNNLKLKEQLVYPKKDSNWEKYLLKSLGNVKYNESKQTIELTVQHPWLFSQIQDYIESNHGQVYIQLNRNLIDLPLDSYIMLVNKAYGSNDMSNQEIENLKGYMKKVNQDTLKDKIKTAIDKVKEIKENYELAKYIIAIFG